MFQYISCYSLSRWSIGLDISIQKFQYISCYSLSRLEIIFLNICKVSIHLMLLFIGIGENRLGKILSFNTSHVTLYLHTESHPEAHECFNTSHVTLYLWCRQAVTLWKYVSIHLMLLFIRMDGGAVGAEHRVSIHLMLLFIGSFLLPVLRHPVSIHLMLLFIWALPVKGSNNPSFNTSHVTLYRICGGRSAESISVSIHLMLLFIADRIKEELEQEQFQYISCYSLSGRKARITIWQGCFNTSHVTLYRCLNGEKFDFEKRFNTSHVTLYPVGWWVGFRVTEFQYISCYSLSVGR